MELLLNYLRTVDVHVLHVFVHAEEVVGRLRQAVAGAHAEAAVGRLLARVVRQTAEEGVHARRAAHHVARHRVLLSQGRRLPHHQSLLQTHNLIRNLTKITSIFNFNM